MKHEEQTQFPVICGQTFVNNTGNHNGTPHICGREYHTTDYHWCRECGTLGY